jgi:hypothetical protein
MPKEITDPKLLSKYEKLFQAQETKPELTPESNILDIGRSIVKGIPGGTQAAAGIASLRPGMTYEKALERLKLEQQLAGERSPVLSEVGEIGGSVLSTLPLGGIGAISKGMKGKELIKPILKQAGVGAGIAGVEPILEGQDVLDIGKEMAIGFGLSAALPTAGAGLRKVGQTLAPVAKSTKQVAKDAYKNLVMSSFGVTREYIDELEKNPKLFDQIMELPVDREKLGADLAKFIQKNPYRMKVKDLSEQRNVLLESSPEKINIKSMVDVFKQAKKSLPSKLSESDKQISNSLDRYIQTYGKGKQEFTAQETKQILDGLRGDIERVGTFGDPTKKSGKLETILKQAQKELNSRIGDQIPQYKTYQRQIQGNLKLADMLERKFMSKNSSDLAIADAALSGETPGSVLKEVDFGKLDAFRNRILSNKATKQDLRLANKIMVDYDYNSMNDLLKNIKTKEYIEARKNQGSNIRNYMIALGGSLGTPFGIPGTAIGVAGGAILGGVAEQRGGYMAGRAMQLPGKLAEAVKSPTEIISKAGKYAKPLQDALSKGNRNFATTHYLLLQRDPEYRKQIEEGTE